MVAALYGAIKLAPNILGGELDVEHRRVDVRVTHETHECRKRDAGPNHVGSESVSEAMRICFRHRAHPAVITKHGTKTGGSKGLSPVWALQDEEKKGRVGFRSFQTQVTLNHLDGLWIKGEESLAVSLSVNEHFILSQAKIIEFEAEGLAGA